MARKVLLSFMIIFVFSFRAVGVGVLHYLLIDTRRWNTLIKYLIVIHFYQATRNLFFQRTLSSLQKINKISGKPTHKNKSEKLKTSLKIKTRIF